MKLVKRALTLVLCGILVLSMAACGNGGGDSSGPQSNPALAGGKGRYVETDITPPGAEGQLQSFLSPEGALVCFNEKLDKRWDSADGGATWTESAGPGANEPSLASAWNYTLLPDGDLLAAIADESQGNTKELVRVSPDGTLTPFPLQALDEAAAGGKAPYVSLIKALSENRLLISFSTGMAYSMGGGEEEGGELPIDDGSDIDTSLSPGAQQDEQEDGAQAVEEEVPEAEAADPGTYQTNENYVALIDLATGEVVAEYPEWFGSTAAAKDGKLYLLDHGGEVLVKNLSDGRDAGGEEMTVPMADFAFNLAVDATPDGGLYVLDGKRIHKLAPGKAAETLMDGSAYSFAGSGLASGLHTLPGGEIVLNLWRQAGSRLYKYAWDAEATLDPAKVLNVWSLEENGQVRTAVNALRTKNPGLVVNYEVALGEDGAATAEDAIKNLNTRLLNGDGPDVLILDGCPVESYTQKGMLKDLNGLVDTSGVFANLRAPFEQDGALYTLPATFRLPLLLGTADDLAKANSLDALAKMITEGNSLRSIANDEDLFAQLDRAEQPVLAPQDLKEMFDYLWSASAPAVISEGQFDAAAAKEFLAALQAISDKYELGKDGGTPSGAMAVMGADGAAATVMGSVLSYASQRSILGAYVANDLQMLDYMMEPPGTEFASFPGLAAGSWTPGTLVGISADTQKEDLAAQLVQAMFSDEVQSVRSSNGFAVTQSGMDKMIADIDEAMQENGNTLPGQEEPGFSFTYAPLVELAQTPNLTDSVLTDAVWKAADALCKGTTTLEGAVSQLELDLKNYLAERQ